MMGSMRTEEASSIFLIKLEAHLFIAAFVKVDLLYIPFDIYSLIPIVGSFLLPYNREVLQISYSSYSVSKGRVLML